MPTLTSSAVFPVVTKAAAQVAVSTIVLPSIGYPNGQGRLVHPTLGTFDYEYKPDEWVNIDGDIIIAPTWAATKTLTGMSHALWQGAISDVVCEERWKSLGGAAMPVTQLRMLMAIWTTPVDPSTGTYVQWFPNYTTSLSYNVIPLDLVVGSAGSSSLARISGAGYQVIVFDDIVNYLDNDGDPFGWVDMPVTFFLKIVSKTGTALAPISGPPENASGVVFFGIQNNNLDNLRWWNSWTAFQLPNGVVLPSDATIQAIYPVIICGYVATDDSINPIASYGVGFDPSSLTYATGSGVHSFGLSNDTGFSPGEYISSYDEGRPSIGTSLSVLSDFIIATTLTAQHLPNGLWTLTTTAVGIAICFTSPTVTVGPNESQMPRPFNVPSNQGVMWALPFAAASGPQNGFPGAGNGGASAIAATYS